MKFLNNRKIAWLVLAVTIAASIAGFGGASLASQRSSAVRVFNDGIDTSFAVRFSMDAYLDNCAEYARTMAEEYRLHVDTGSAFAKGISELAGRVESGDDIADRRKAYQTLCSEIETLYTDFHAAVVAEEDQGIFKNAYANFQGEVNKIKYDAYHSLASEYNAAASGFPASALGALFGLEPLDTF